MLIWSVSIFTELTNQAKFHKIIRCFVWKSHSLVIFNQKVTDYTEKCSHSDKDYKTTTLLCKFLDLVSELFSISWFATFNFHFGIYVCIWTGSCCLIYFINLHHIVSSSFCLEYQLTTTQINMATLPPNSVTKLNLDSSVLYCRLWR